MSLENGTRLGPYEILSLLGAGGMGEVYRARDARLGREVAIKVLPADAAADAGRLKRFEKEARSASALNHPNIVTIYDVGSEAETTYIAMELVVGRTLRELLLSGPMPLKRLLQVATQLAEGLAAAHEAGIVHRDLKPENVMVTKEGLVKILDFGLAKLVPAIGSGESSLPTVSRTEPGGLLGTVSYMSPEQAAGQPVDFRSDQFSFGAILYEMVTGKRAFNRGTAVDTLAAILHEEPEPLGKLDPSVLAPLRWNVERCLAKDPADRYAATRDLARDLKAIREHAIESGEFSVALGPRRRLSRLWAGGAVAFLAIGALLLSFHAGRKSDPVRAALNAISSYRVTFRRGNVVNARFAPDGETIVYSASWEGTPQEVYVTSIHAAESRPLGIPNAQLLSVSSTGELAVLLKTFDLSSHQGDGTLARVSLTGGAPREILANVTWMVDWGSAGQIAVRRDGGGKSRIEYPIGKTIYETSSGKINGPRVSPDGESVAFFDRSRGAADLVVVNRAGQRRVLLRMSDLFSSWGYLAWHPSGREIWFDAIQGEKQPGLFAVTLSGAHRVLMRPAVRVILMDVSRDGRALVEALDSRVELMFGRVGEGRERDLSWLGEVRNVDIARDGGSVLFTEVGEGSGPNGTVFLRRTDGSPAIRLADGMAQGLAPDGKSALILVRDPAVKLLRVPTGAGQSEVIPVGSLVVQGAVWLPDGKRVFLLASEPGQATEGFLMELPNGKPQPFGPEGPLWAVFSSDSRLALIGRVDGKQLIYPVEGGEPRSVPGLLPAEVGDPYVTAGPFNSDASAVYLSHFRESRIDLVDLKTGRRTFWKELVPADRAGVTRIQEYTIGADDRSYAYTVARVVSDAIYVIEGLR